MAHRKMTLTDKGAQVYRNRMLTSGDPVTLAAGDARLFEKHGWAEEPKRARRSQFDNDGKAGGSKSPPEDLAALRAEYFKKLGKRPFNGWDAATLREKIAAA